MAPTVHPAPNFNAKADADTLYSAMKGLGTDEKGLIKILCHRSHDQRVQIAQAFKAHHKKDLESMLKSELSGNFERVMVGLTMSPAEFLAREVNSAIKGFGTNEGDLIEILCSLTGSEMDELRLAYYRVYGKQLKEEIKGDTSGILKHLLVSFIQHQRSGSDDVSMDDVKRDVQVLYKAGAASLGTDEGAFSYILATRSWAHIRALMAEYQHASGHSLEKAIEKEFKGNEEKALLAILQCAKSRTGYYAQVLHSAIRGLGTNDRDLIRVVVSRCDFDLADIKKEYEKTYGKSLKDVVSGDTSGDYRKALLALID